MRNSEEIVIWLIRTGIRQSDVAKKIGISRSAVSQWVWNKASSNKIAMVFKEYGCPSNLIEKEKLGM